MSAFPALTAGAPGREKDPMRIFNSHPSPLLFLAPLVMAACGGGTTGPTPPPPPPPPPVPGAIAAVTPQTQTATVGQGVTVTVRVTTTTGQAVPNASVSFGVQAGGGTVDPSNTTTDDQGQTSVNWTMGTAAGTNTLRAAVGAVAPVDFTVTGVPGAVATLTLRAGNNQTVTVGSNVPIAPSVSAKDQFGNPVPNTTVTFAILAGGGSVAGGSEATDATGVAAVGSWTMGTIAGINTMSATVGNLPRINFQATATPGPPFEIVGTQGQNQTATVASAVPIVPTVLVRDQFGNGIPNLSVNFTVTAGGGSVSDGAASTTNQGAAAPTGWTLGTRAGLNTLTVTVAGMNSGLGFNSIGTPGPATHLAVVAGDNQSARVGDPVLLPPTVSALDLYQNPVPNVPVTFAVTAGGGSVTGQGSNSDGQGLAHPTSWVLGLFNGNHQLTATTSGAPPVSFTATGLSGWTSNISGNIVQVFRNAEPGSDAVGTPWSATILQKAPFLVVGCITPGGADVFVFNSRLITKNGIVAYTFDGGSPLSDVWIEVSPNFDSLFHPGSSAANQGFAAALAVTKVFRFAFTDFRGSTFVATFDVRGLGLELNRVMAGC